jgi:hypothetical protein
MVDDAPNFKPVRIEASSEKGAVKSARQSVMSNPVPNLHLNHSQGGMPNGKDVSECDVVGSDSPALPNDAVN